MGSDRPFFEVWLEHHGKVKGCEDIEENFDESPLCMYPEDGCNCMRKRSNKGLAKCFYKRGPDECCLKKEKND